MIRVTEYKTIISPTNHGLFVYILVSRFNRDKNEGLHFVEKIFVRSAYAKVIKLDETKFSDEAKLYSFHVTQVKKYLKISRPEENENEFESEECQETSEVNEKDE